MHALATANEPMQCQCYHSVMVWLLHDAVPKAIRPCVWINIRHTLRPCWLISPTCPKLQHNTTPLGCVKFCHTPKATANKPSHCQCYRSVMVWLLWSCAKATEKEVSCRCYGGIVQHGTFNQKWRQKGARKVWFITPLPKVVLWSCTKGYGQCGLYDTA